VSIEEVRKKRREGKGRGRRRSIRNGRELKRSKWSKWKRINQGRLDRVRRDAANVIVGKESRR